MNLSKKLRRLSAPLAVLMATLLIAAGTAFAITALTPITPLGPYIAGQPSANSLNFSFAACDSGAGNSFKMTGRDVLLVENADTMAAHTFTATSVADQLGRTNDITAYSLVAGPTFAAFNFRGGVNGWQQPSDSTVHLTCSSTSILFAVITTPN